MITLKDFMILLEDVTSEVAQELEKRKLGEEGVGSVQDLEFIFSELSSLGSSLIDSKDLQPTERAQLRSAGIVMHSWPAQESLGERICMIDNLYRNKLSIP